MNGLTVWNYCASIFFGRRFSVSVSIGDTQIEADKHAEQLPSECEFVSGRHRLALNLDYDVTALRYLRKHHHDERLKPATKKVNVVIATACTDDLIYRPMAAMVKSRAGKNEIIHAGWNILPA